MDISELAALIVSFVSLATAMAGAALWVVYGRKRDAYDLEGRFTKLRHELVKELEIEQGVRLKCENEIDSLTDMLGELKDLVATLKKDIESLEKAQDSRDREISKLHSENKELVEFSLLVLSWMRIAIQKFELAGIDSPELPVDFIDIEEFERKYSKKG